MKKYILILLSTLSLFYMSSCGATAPSLSPDSIKIGNSTLSYDDKEIPEIFWDSGVDFKVNENNEIRCITITSSVVDAYNGISVGDSSNRIESAYKYETKFGDDYLVLFEGNTEIRAGTQTEDGDYIWISYYINDDNLIESMQIYDAVYGKTLK